MKTIHFVIPILDATEQRPVKPNDILEPLLFSFDNFDYYNQVDNKNNENLSSIYNFEIILTFAKKYEFKIEQFKDFFETFIEDHPYVTVKYVCVPDPLKNNIAYLYNYAINEINDECGYVIFQYHLAYYNLYEMCKLIKDYEEYSTFDALHFNMLDYRDVELKDYFHDENIISINNYVKFHDCNNLNLSCMMFNSEIFLNLKTWFQPILHKEFQYFLDNLILHNYEIRLINDIFYGNVQNKMLSYTGVTPYMSHKMYKTFKYSPNNKFTIVIVYRNEGDEILNTILSINESLYESQNILLVDDGSTDNYNYKYCETLFDNVKYIKIEKQEGVAVQRTKAIMEYVETKYWMIIDGHMRFYDNCWEDTIANIIENEPNNIYCSNTVILTRDSQIPTIINNEDGLIKDKNLCGSIIDFKSDNYKANWFKTTRIWNQDNLIKYSKELVEIPCILGACYFGSTDYFKSTLNGLDVLKIYGSDEQFLSIANWMAGNKNILVKNFWVGHIYRDNKWLKNNHPSNGTYQLFNAYLIRYIFNDDNIEEILDNVKAIYSYNTFKLMHQIYYENYEYIEKVKKQIKKQSTRTFDEYKKFTKSFEQKPEQYVICES